MADAPRLTPGVARWLTHLAEHGPSRRPMGTVGFRASRAGYTSWWMRDTTTGAEMIHDDIPAKHRPTRARYEHTELEALTPVGRAALAAQSAVAIGPGTRQPYGNGEIRVMAVAEGYAMVRRSGCAPFVVTLKEMAAARDEGLRARGGAGAKHGEG